MGKVNIVKCIIWDLDETIWKGTLDNGDKVELLSDITELIERIDLMGILQSIASRNDYETAMKQLRKFKLEKYFLFPQINYLPKVNNIKKIIKLMNICSSSVIFIDDNEFELSWVNYSVPNITTMNNIKKLESFLENSLNQNSNNSTFECKNRRELMKSRINFEQEKLKFKGTDYDFLSSCNMNLVIRKGNENDIKRVEELSVRTNQLNSFKENINSDIIKDFITLDDKMLYICELTDKFGHHGVVGVCFIEVSNFLATIKQFCISCRIEGRGIAYSFLSLVIENIKKNLPAIDKIICNYLPTSNNSSAVYLLKSLKFKFEFDVNNDSIQNLYYKVYSLKTHINYNRVNWLTIKNLEDD